MVAPKHFFCMDGFFMFLSCLARDTCTTNDWLKQFPSLYLCLEKNMSTITPQLESIVKELENGDLKKIFEDLEKIGTVTYFAL